MAGSLECWAVDQEQLLSAIGASENGLSGQEARRRPSPTGAPTSSPVSRL